MQNLFECRRAVIFVLIPDAQMGFVDTYQLGQVDRRCKQYQVTVALIDGGLQILDLLRAVSHCRNHLVYMGVLLQRLLHAAHGTGPGGGNV